MAARVNTKFVVILASSIVVVAGLIVGVVVYAKGTTAEQYAAQSKQREARYEQAIAQGDKAAASSAIRSASTFAYRAYEKSQDPEQLLRSAQLLKKYQAKDAPDAQQHLAFLRKQAKDLSDKYPQTPEYQTFYFDLLYDLTHDFGGLPQVAQLESEAQAALDVYPDNLAALRARGIARTRRLSDQLPVDQRQQAADDLERVIRENPDDARATYYLAIWKINEADRLTRSSQRIERAQELRAEAVAMTARILDEAPDNLERLFYHVQCLRASGTAAAPSLRAAADRLAEAVLADPTNRRVTVFAAMVYPAMVRATEFESADARREAILAANQRRVEIFRAATQRSPEDPVFRLQLGNALRGIGDAQAATAELKKARQRPSRSPLLDFFIYSAAADDATFSLSDLSIQQALASRDAEERTRLLEAAEEAALVLVDKQINPRITDNLLGRIDYARQQWMSAANRLTRASDAVENRDLRLLALSAEALDRSGQATAAIRRYEMAIRLGQTIPGLDLLATRVRLAALYLNQRDLDRAKSQIDTTLEADPDNARAQLLLSRYHELTRDPDAALRVLDAKADNDTPQAALNRAAILRRSGRLDDAFTVIAEASRAHPDNAALVIQELMLTPVDQLDRRLELIERARELGASSSRLDLIAKQLKGEDLTDEDLAELLLRDNDDPIAAKINRARFFERQGNREQRRTLFAEAEAEAPDHPSVVLAGFDFALADDQPEAARSYATRAARANLDQTQGNTLQARLASSLGNHAEAITFLNRALELNAVNAALWEQLGQAEAASGDLEGAEAAFQSALRLNAGSVGSLLGLAVVRQNRGATDEALNLLRRAYAIRPNNPLVRANYFGFEAVQGDVSRVITERLAIAESTPGDRQNRRALAITLASAERFDEATAIARELIADESAALSDTAVLAQVLVLADRAAQAEQALLDYISRQGSSVTMMDHLALARFYVQQGQASESVAAFERAVEAETPDNRAATRALADYLSNTNRADRAVALYRELLEANPDDDALLTQLAVVCVRLELVDEATGYVERMGPSAQKVLLAAQLAAMRGDRGSALDQLAAGLDRFPNEPRIRMLRAQTLANDPERHDEAIADLNTLIESGSEVRAARRLRARLWAINADTQGQAIAELRSLVGQDPADDASRRLLISVLERNGGFAEAAVVAAEVLEAGRSTPDWYTLTGRLLARADQPDRAIDRLRESLSLEPTAQALGVLFDVLVSEERFEELVATADNHAPILNRRPGLEALKARALIATGQTDAGRNLFASLLGSASNTATESAIVAQFLRADAGADAVAWLGQQLGVTRGYDLAMYRAMHHFSVEEHAAVVGVLGAVDRAGLPDARVNRLDALIAQALHADDRYTEAAAAYERALQLRPDDFSSLNNLAVILAERLDQPERALGYARRADQLRPNIPEVADTIGFCLLQLERYDEAAEALEASRQLAVAQRGRPLPLTLVHIAELHLALSDFRQAEIEANAAIKGARQLNDITAKQRAQTVLERLDNR